MDFEPDPYRPVNRRRRVLIAFLAVATAWFVAWAMTRKSGVVRHAAQNPADVAACSGKQTEACVGSITRVIAVPGPAGPASASPGR